MQRTARRSDRKAAVASVDVLALALALGFAWSSSAVQGQMAGALVDKQDLLSLTPKAIQTAGNDIYQIFIDDDPVSGNCGTWTATTGASHPAGSGLNVLFGTGIPRTSNTVLRSYTSGTDYSTGDGCTEICAQAAPVVTPILNGATTVGYRLVWTFADGAGPTIEVEEEVVVEGPVDGSETVDNTVIRETHTVRNLGPGNLSFGLRKQWDWSIGADDGPYFGTCEAPNVACDASMNLTDDGSLDGPYPPVYVINEDPAVTACPVGVNPVGPNCGGSPLYLVAGTVSAPATLTPAPDPPELVQFNDWPSLIGSCWQPPLVDNATCGNGDTALAYFYGLTIGSAITLTPAEERSFTQYVVASQDECPAIIEEPVNPLEIPGLTPLGLVVLVGLIALAGSAVLFLGWRGTP